MEHPQPPWATCASESPAPLPWYLWLMHYRGLGVSNAQQNSVNQTKQYELQKGVYIRGKLDTPLNIWVPFPPLLQFGCDAEQSLLQFCSEMEVALYFCQ